MITYECSRRIHTPGVRPPDQRLASALLSALQNTPEAGPPGSGESMRGGMVQKKEGAHPRGAAAPWCCNLLSFPPKFQLQQRKRNLRAVLANSRDSAHDAARTHVLEFSPMPRRSAASVDFMPL